MSVSVPRLVVAQNPEPTSEQLADKAHRAHDLGRYDEAIDAYARAYQISGEPGLLFGMAEAHREAGHDADALRTYTTYLRRDPQGANREIAERQIKELEQKARRGGSGKAAPLGATAPKASPKVTPTAAAPSVVTPPPPMVPPPRAVTPPPPVTPPPRAVTPPPMPPPVLTQTSPSPASVDLTAPASAPSQEGSPSAGPPLPRWVPWTLAATTVALGTAAVISGMSASNRFDELKASCGQTTQGCEDEPISDLKSRARRTNILWALTSVAAVATGVTVYVNVNAAGVAGIWAF